MFAGHEINVLYPHQADIVKIDLGKVPEKYEGGN